MKKEELEKTKERLLEGKVAIVTGAARGIGKGIAEEFLREGAVVVIADVDGREAEKTREELNGLGVVLNIPTDVGNDKENERLVNKVLEKLDRIDILVNNAGINLEGGILEITKEGAMSVFQTNLLGPFFLTQRVAQEMVKRGTKGAILFTSSVHGQITQLHPAHTASKAALEMFVRDIALELAQYGIRVNAVAPGAIAIRVETERTNPHVPLGYSGTPEDVANAMVFLASDKGGYITGQTLVVDGGFSLAHTHYWIKKGVL